MLSREQIAQQLAFTIDQIDIPGLGGKISGKVRDCYVQQDRRILIASDRLSAFDVILCTIPFKGQILTEMATFWFQATKHIVPNHILSAPHPNVMISQEVEIVPIEVIVRGYLTGSAWRDYQAGRAISGIDLPQGIRKSQRFETPLITPSTKAEMGQHDQPISSAEIVSSGLVEKSLWDQISETALSLFAFGTKKAAEQGLILVDTKYEFGVQRINGKVQLVLADEIHTSDSSRYWLSESYVERFENGEDPDMLDKEFVRRELIAQGYMGEGTPPTLSDEFRIETAIKYMQAYEKVTGQKFSARVGSAKEEIVTAVISALG